MLGRLWSIQVNQKRALWLTFQPAWPVTSNIYRFCFCGNILDTKEHIYIYTTFELQLRLFWLPCYTPVLDFLGKDIGKPLYFQTCSRIATDCGSVDWNVGKYSHNRIDAFSSLAINSCSHSGCWAGLSHLKKNPRNFTHPEPKNSSEVLLETPIFFMFSTSSRLLQQPI